ncbi:hypothetical protein [Flavobacterium sp. NKUCC04_CG]|uniref:hypothetical protein n=1 Tax=Flavobacterium sp. NKUCC04_CG TaxID=2842121 RepID=UPI001C5BF419|nr:hypothetical protein [Flavobacterium sp. NKUCC04_CG]MBW3518481.1 hypothetical protein [Flavobacterium sp. NKUCC04_CG]
MLLFVSFIFTAISYGQQSGCPQDFDCDGITDDLDVDDDNDGIYDHIEAPNCFYLDKSVFESGDRSDLLVASTTLPFSNENPAWLIGGMPSPSAGLTIAGSVDLTQVEIMRLTTKAAAGIEYTAVTLNFNGTYFFAAFAKVVLQGSHDGDNWLDLSEVVAPGSGANITVEVTKNQRRYQFYRLLGVEGLRGPAIRVFRQITAQVGSYMPSFYQKANCVDEDIDGDGMPNHQDLDSDGDGAFDVVEAGFIDADNNGHPGSGRVLVDEDGAIVGHHYRVPYEFYKIATINAGKDTDGDGIYDVFDVDADNDGIYNHFESPNCYESDKTTYETGNRTSLMQATTTLNYVSGKQEYLIDGIATSAQGITWASSQTLQNQEVFRLTTRLALGIQFSSIDLIFNGAGAFTPSSRLIMQGSQDGIDWVDLTEEIKPSTAANVTIVVTKNQDIYRMYRLLGQAGTTGTTSRSLMEITAITQNYLPALYPKINCTNEDLDLDGVANHLDLDSDGDGASDVLEAGFSDPDGDGFVGVAPVLVNRFGAVDGHGYLQPLGYYKIREVVATDDFDGDGVFDLFDVDDDNDGIFDHIESPNCFELDAKIYEIGDRRHLLEVTTTLPIRTGNADLLIDGIETLSNIGIQIPAATALGNKEIFRLTTTMALSIEYASIRMLFNTTGFFSNGSQVILQATNDGINWIDLTEGISPSLSNESVFVVTKNQALYRSYRLWGIAGFTGTTARNILEITATVANYHPSLYPKMGCNGHDVNGNGRPNHQDLNADGDSCFDVTEVGFEDPDRDGILGISPVTVDQYGKVIGAVGYTLPRNLYWLEPSRNVCTGVGIPIDEDSHCLDMGDITNDYGLIQSLFHMSMVRTKSGFSIFGEHTSPSGVGNLLFPTEIIPSNGFNYGGDIIAGTVGGGYSRVTCFVLSTAGLYTWGVKAQVPQPWRRSGRGFQSIPLPDGINPRDVKVISATASGFDMGSLVLLTKWGDVYVLAAGAQQSAAVYGDGSTAIDFAWHKVLIGQVVSVKLFGTGTAMALTLNGDLFTWGSSIFLGDGSNETNSAVPVKMTLPNGVNRVIMTAMTGESSTLTYYVLGDDKRVYSLGYNVGGVLGIGIDGGAVRTSWQTVMSPTGSGVGTGTGFLENIKFINGALHNPFSGAAGAIDEDGVPYFWGSNEPTYVRLGFNGGNVTQPRIPNGITPGVHDIMYIELGGHVTPVIDKKLGKYGYVGHKIAGSMGDGGQEATITVYDFTNTPVIDFCNIVIGEPKKTRVTINPMNINLPLKKLTLISP